MRTLTICILATAAAAMAQENPLSAFNKRSYGQIKGWLLGSAEKMPEESYGFQPTDTVRTFGQLVGHVSDAQYMFCASVRGEKSPAAKIEGNKTAKSDLIVALKEAFVYCDKAYNEMTDANGLETVKLFGGDTPKLSVMSVNITHLAEHYGNMATYLRIKNIVPPSTEQMARPPAKK